MPVSINGTSGLVFNDSSTQTTAATGFGFKNRIINGAMMIDQRNAGAAITPSNGQYTVDRFVFYATQSAKFTCGQGSGGAPAGFSNYLAFTSASAYSVLSSDFFAVGQPIEGFNVADFSWGTANASAATLSFRVFSSLTGTFGGAVRNSAANRSYPFTYSVSVANTWTTISVTIPGDTSGTWVTNNGVGLYLTFGLGSGSTFSGTAGSWQAGNFISATGAQSVVGTNGATFYITGVQLEKGSTATSFDYRPYGTELALCQRYYTKSFETNTAPGTATSLGAIPICVYLSGSFTWQLGGTFVVPMRSAPTVSYWDANGNASKVSYLGNGTTTFNNNVSLSSGGPFNASTSGFTFQSNVSTNGTYFIQYTASAEL